MATRGDADTQAGPPAGNLTKEQNGENNMNVVNVTKPKVEYEGYKRTITDVVRTRQEERGGVDETGVSTLMEGIDDAIKTCRNLRQRLARLHQKRNTGHYATVRPKTS